MRSKLFLGLTLVGILWIFAGEGPRPALACSFGWPTLDHLILEDQATVVVGRFVRVDGIQRNGLFEVRQYLAGDGDTQYLTVYQASSELNAAISQGADVECDTVGNVLSLDHDAILFLRRNGDGSFSSISNFHYVFPTEGSRQVVHIGSDDTLQDQATGGLTLGEMVEVITDISGEAPREPNPDSQRPFLTPLLIVTEQGTAYMLPVDGADPVLLAEDYDSYQVSGHRIMFVRDDEVQLIDLTRPTNSEGEPQTGDTALIDCPQQNCASISSRGIFTANFIPGDKLVLDIYTRLIPGTDYSQNYITRFHIPGPVYGYSFSPQDNLLAVWHEDNLEVYSLGFSSVQRPVVTSINIMRTSDGLLPGGAWSADERRMAFTDADGLWLWDVHSDERRLLIETADEAPIAKDFSGQGNYLHVQKGDEAFYLDVATGEHHPTGFMSPDEQWLAILPSEDNMLGRVCNLIRDDCQTATWSFTEYIWQDTDEAVIWTFRNGIGLPATQRQHGGTPAMFHSYSEICYLSYPVDYAFPEPDERDDLPWFYGIAFGFEPTSQMIVVQNDPNTISVGYQLVRWQSTPIYSDWGSELTAAACNDFVTFDLADKIDGEIVSVEWLPSIFIEE